MSLLALAARSDNVRLLNLLKPLRLNRRRTKEVIAIAVESGSTAILRSLLKRYPMPLDNAMRAVLGLPVQGQLPMDHSRGNTILHYIAVAGRTDQLEAIRPTPSDWLAPNGAGDSPIELAIQKQRMDIVLRALSDGLEVSARALRLMAHLGAEQLLQAALQTCSRGTVNARDALGMTALHYACTANSAACVQLLLEYGANHHVQSLSGLTPLDFTAGDPQSAMLLIDHGARITTIGAIASEDEYLVRTHILASHRRLPLAEDGISLLHHAAMGSNPVIVTMLIEAGGDTLSQAHHLGTPGHFAARRGRDVLKLLVTDPLAHPTSATGESLSHAAAEAQGIGGLRWLAGCGVDLEAVDCHRDSPLHHAMMFDRFANAQFLLSKEVPITQDKARMTPLDIAIRHDAVSAVIGWLEEVETRRPTKDVC